MAKVQVHFEAEEEWVKAWKLEAARTEHTLAGWLRFTANHAIREVEFKRRKNAAR